MGTEMRIVVSALACRPGLPDISWYKIPKRGKIYQMTPNIPKGHKIFPIAVK
jgi:hypothetical protein